jgi:hypothetical protein
MFKKKIILSVLTCLICATNAVAGPFGLEMGMSLEQIGGNPKEMMKGAYELKTVPKPDPAFETYIVEVAPKGGLYRITAMGKRIPTDFNGTEVMIEFKDMEKKLEASYGEHLREYSKRGRDSRARWEPMYRSSLPSDLKFVVLLTKPATKDGGRIIIEYSFTNRESCEAELGL